MKTKRTQQSAWRRHMDSEVASASQVTQRATTRERRLKLSRQEVNTVVGPGTICSPSHSDTPA